MKEYNGIDITKLDWNAAHRLFLKMPNTEKGIIYCYTNSINGKKYVGQTISPKIRHNCHTHFSRNTNKRESGMPFHHALRKYGLSNFKYEIIELVIEPTRQSLIKELDRLERFYITELHSLVTECGYNILPGSAQAKSHGLAYNARPVRQFNLDGELIAEFECVHDAANATGLSNISLPLRDSWRQAGGFLWRYAPDVVSEDVIEYYRKKQVHQYSVSGEYIASFRSTSEASNATGVPSDKINDATKNPRLTFTGYRWVRGVKLDKLDSAPSKPIKVPIYGYDGNTGAFMLEFESASEAGRQTGIMPQSILQSCKKERCRAGGYFWSKKKMDVYPIPPNMKTCKYDSTVYQYGLDGTYIRSYKNQSEANKVAGYSIHHALDKKLTAGGFQWRTCFQLRIPPIKEHHSPKHIPVHSYNENGNYVASYCTIADAAREVGLKSYTPIALAIQETWRMAGGFYWRKEQVDKISPRISRKGDCLTMVYKVNGEHVGTYSNMKEASKELGVSVDSIRRSYRSQKPYKGYIFKIKRITDNGID